MANNVSASFYRLNTLDLVNHEGIKITIKDIFVAIDIVEDIFQNFMFGSIVVSEAVDLQQFFPLVGEEQLIISYSTDENQRNSIDYKFRIYRIESSTSEQNRIIHTMHFVSEEAFNSANISLSKSWKAKSTTSIVMDAFKQISSKRFDVGQFAGRHHVISPNWSPIQLINYIASISFPKNYSGSLILFYESSKGFAFKHIEELIDSQSIGEWIVGTSKTMKPDEPINPHNYIQNYKIIKNSVDNLDAVFSGLYANISLSYDNISKTYRGHQFEYKKQYQNTKHLNEFPLNSNNSIDASLQQKIMYFPSNNHRDRNPYYMANSDIINVGNRKEIAASWRTSLISQISAKQIELTLIGDELIHAGTVMNIRMPSISETDINTHRYNTKKVLVTKVRHTFTKDSHEKKVLVSDDSYADDMKSQGFE